LNTFGVSGVLVSLLGCSPAASTPAPAPTPAPVAAATQAAVAAPAAKPTTAPTAAPAAWQAEWDRTLAAAKQESQLAVAGQAGETWRVLIQSFEKDYPGISVQYAASTAQQFWPKVREEQAAGQYLWDVRQGGINGGSFEARDDGILAPLRPLFLLPEVTDDTKWWGGLNDAFVDRDKQYILSFLNYVSFALTVNRDYVSATDFTSIEDLLDPRWKGKIVMYDPRGGGASAAFLLGFRKFLGDQALRDLLTTQDVALTTDARQEVEWLVRGRYPIGIGVSDGVLVGFKAQGVGTNAEDVYTNKGGTLSSGAGGLQVFKNPPHPNAARVFVNWFLSREVQARMSQAVEKNSRRLDIAPAQPDLWPDVSHQSQYLAQDKEETIPYIRETDRLIQESLQGR
jgi:iron(III) transport system substrate-binding protein